MSCGARRRIRPPHCLTNPSVECNSSSAPLCFTPDSPSLTSFLSSSRPSGVSFHGGSLCPRTHHDGYSSLLHLITSYVHYFLFTLQYYLSCPFSPGPTYPQHFNPIPHFIPLATFPARVTSAMVSTFQQLKVVCLLGATMGPIGLWVSGWLYPKGVITAPAATTPFSSCLNINVSGFCNN